MSKDTHSTISWFLITWRSILVRFHSLKHTKTLFVEKFTAVKALEDMAQFLAGLKRHEMGGYSAAYESMYDADANSNTQA